NDAAAATVLSSRTRRRRTPATRRARPTLRLATVDLDEPGSRSLGKTESGPVGERISSFDRKPDTPCGDQLVKRSPAARTRCLRGRAEFGDNPSMRRYGD